ncbi:Flavin reductase domain-containing FMN-binding protein [Sulfitobacter noctilucicola]|uniref:Flavin reductase (DIM6/NTAB) family NADH-FMN oxidoreductase RutF n=1 Tax=Sulfitobacter noctilucicola TaxID=1342301 RepID=A0A7W6M6G2_9RHOB|nr:flavin reductase family protein [Sulfitobacter noctilucicola]KIN62267.1 Flavin reductase domain-containing FMN-binding protein [Sulfitobacter noctilucicola]MBB4173221.1 flavin reductase (DIM6/NTAB) family NADH-FMN oxidoreductase RutF [Sulfitobacter noctilucicola]
MPEISPKSFTNALRALVGNCSIISVGLGNDKSGLVVTSAISLSAEPPLLLACVNRNASSWPLLKKYGCFGWSSLGAGHQDVGEKFAGFGGVKGPARYEGAEWETCVTGASLLKGAPSAFDCEVDEMIDRGTHSIVIGRVRAIRGTAQAGALIYWNGQFQELHS